MVNADSSPGRARSYLPVRCFAALGLFVLSGFACAGNGISADRQADQLDEIVVVAHKAERELREVAANVTVLTRQALRDSLSVDIADAVRYTPGLDYEAAGSRFGTEGLSIRGIGGNRVAMLIDGVPVGDQFDIGNFSNATRDFINAGLVKRAEILHGPASALYGSAAIGGVLAVVTPDPGDVAGNNRRGAELRSVWREADDSLLATAIVAAGDSDRGMLLAGSRQNGSESLAAALRGEPDRRDFLRNTALLKLLTDDSAGRSWRIGVLHQASSVDSDLRSMLGSGRFASTTALLGDDEQTLDLVHAGVEFGSPDAFIDAGVIRVFYGETAVEQKTVDERAAAARPVLLNRHFGYEQSVRGVEVNLQKTAGGRWFDHRLAAGVEVQRTRTEEWRDGVETGLVDGQVTRSILGETFPLRDFPVTETDQWGAYVEDTAMLGDWIFVAAVRADRFDLSPRVDRMFHEDNPATEPVALSESDLSPKLGVIRQLGENSSIYLQYAHGFRAPPFEDANIGLDIPLFNIRAVPNPDLRSEESDGIDVGFRWRSDRVALHLGLFHTRYRDFIESKVRLGTDPASGRILFQSQNISRTRIEGIEAGWRMNPSGKLANWSFDGALYAARGENRDTGEPLNSVGPPQAVLGLHWKRRDGGLGVRLQSTLTADWSERDRSGGDLFEPPGAAIFDLLLTRALGDRANLRAGIMNLTDRTWWYWGDVRGLSPDDPVLPTLSRPGRSLVVGIDMAWQ